MAKIIVNNPKQVINGGAKKYYFKVKGLGGPKGDKGDKGDTGSQGPQGPQGNAATVSVGSTTTLPVGQDATVQNVGTLYNAVLNFGIPQGPRGPQGATGAKGDKGDKGEQGNPGPQGEKGTNATVYIGTTSTLNPGSQATVYNSGTDSNAVLNFGIPKGEKGDTGPMPTIAQTTGQAIDQVMSQKATTDALNTKQATITSSNKLSADLVTDTSTTNKFVTASDITNWNAKQDALTAGTGIDITGGVISTPAIVPEVVTELPTTGAEGKLYLTPKAHTTSTATGNPITISLGEDAGQITSAQLDGDTYQQTYTGKNMVGFPARSYEQHDLTFNFDADGTITINGTRSVTTATNYNSSVLFNFSAGNSTYTIIPISGSFSGANIGYRALTENTQAWYQVVSSSGNYNPGTINKTAEQVAEITRIELLIGSGTAVFDNFKFKIQVTAGSDHDTDYEPYVGGQPSPNPDYPQQIQTVTGTQTISINGTNYPIDLGSIELCKLGTYQDYIYKDGSDWKVHKAIGKYIFETASGTGANWEAATHRVYFTVTYQNAHGINLAGHTDATTQAPLLADKFKAISFNDLYVNGKSGIALSPTKTLSIRNNSWTDETTARNEITGTTMHYALATATDTTITDTTLIAQLEAIRTTSLQNGTNTITNTATGSNLAGDMEIGYYGFNPTNRYDKFIWLDLNNNYEQIGGE